ncbi:hypothetical protein [Teichococcus aestuarii]|uniref:hypothetical protein n=1 Tax=Teichococcus aestuarii TaxID=568898 RepID=UPI00361C5827
MTLIRRASAGQPQRNVVLTGFARPFRPGEVEGPIQQGDQQVEILHDEIAAAEWPWPPRLHDALDMGRQVTLQAATPIYDGAALAGWSLWVRG